MIPKPCSYKGEKLNPEEFFVGDEEITYEIERRNYAQRDYLPLDLLSVNTTLTCRNGQNASQFANYNDTEKTIVTYANATTPWCKQTVIRECDIDSRLIEMYIDIEVLINKYPEFMTEVRTDYEISLRQSQIAPPPTRI